MPRTHPAELSDAGLAQLLRTETDPEHLRTAQVEALRRLPVRPLQGGGYVVASRTVKGAHWLVDPSAPERERCTCPAEVPTCHHQRLVAAWCRLQDSMRARPTPAPNIGALVD